MKDKLKKLWIWLRKEILNKGMLVWLIIAEAIFWSPCIAGAILGALVNSWYYTICGVYAAFWAGPFTPAIPLQIGLAYGLKKMAEGLRKFRRRKKEKKMNEKTDQIKEMTEQEQIEKALTCWVGRRVTDEECQKCKFGIDCDFRDIVEETLKLIRERNAEIERQENFAKEQGFTPDCSPYYIALHYKKRAEEVRKETAKEILKILYDYGIDKEIMELCSNYDVNGIALAEEICEKYGVEVEE